MTGSIDRRRFLMANADKRALISIVMLASCSAILLGVFTVPAYAEDAVKILDGGTVRGYILEENDDYVLIRRKTGDIQKIDRDRVEDIEYGPAFEVEFKKKWEKIQSSDADGAYDLGLWCEDRGRPAEATKCFHRAIEANPNHQTARERLGHMYHDGKWYEKIEEYYTAKGFVKYKDNWIPKEDKQKYEAGLVKLDDGTWVSKTKLEEMRKKREREAKTAPKRTDRKPKKGNGSKDKKPWKRQKRDDAFYEDFSGEVPWANRHRYESNHYAIESNCSMKHIKRYAKMLDLVYQKYCKTFGKPSSPRKCQVRIYARQQQMGRGPGVGGFYGGGRVTCYHGKFGRTGSTQTVLFHECTHQFHDMVAGIRRAQIWFTEGLASFFECSEVDEKGKIHVGVVNKDRLGTVQVGVKKGNYIKLETLLSTPQSGFSGRHYAYAWTVIYFLVYTNTNNRKLFNRYWTQVCCGSGESRGSPKFKKMIGVPLQDLEECWKEWVQILGKNDLPEDVEEKSKDFFKNYKKKKTDK
jgi:hypothetical protein